ncbi:hypothetical protein KR074_004823, partial [Drosophila pseudoananassae]
LFLQFVCVSLALFAYINASPYGGRGGYGGYGGQEVAYESIRGGYGGHNHGGYQQEYRPLVARGEQPRAAAAAASAAAAVNQGSYRQFVVPSYEIDGGYNGPSHGGYGRGGY